MMEMFEAPILAFSSESRERSPPTSSVFGGPPFPEFYPESYYNCNYQQDLCYQDYVGPATVPMVSTNSSPPMAMPVSVPPGHIIEQVVDQNGTLRHVILSAQGPPLVPMAPGYGTGPNPSTGGYYQYPSQYPTPPPFPPPTQPVHQPPSHNSCSYLQNERSQRQLYKLKKKLQQRKLEGSINTTIQNNNKDVGDSVEETETPEEQELLEDPSEDMRMLIEILSRLAPPTVEEITSRTALLEWTHPTGILNREETDDTNSGSEDTNDLCISPKDLNYEVFLSDRGRDFRSIYLGQSLDCRLTDLQPATEYSIKLQAYLEDVKGMETEAVTFKTGSCEPDTPQPPKFVQKTKTSLQLRWDSPANNGSRITHYILEWDEGKSGLEFIEVYKGSNKQYKLTRLAPATFYHFRLAAHNDLGKSPYSEIAVFSTGGIPPAQPVPPVLYDPGVSSLLLAWQARPQDDEYTLQMDDEFSGHGFINAYHGPSTQYLCKQLLRNHEYKFRLRANNEEGPSKWSDVITYSTLCDRPSPPTKVQIKGKVLSHTCRITWEPPVDDGGGEIVAYILEMDKGDGWICLNRGMDCEYVVDGLRPGGFYKFRVSCRGTGGASSPSDLLEVRTLAVFPSQCQRPQLNGKPKATSVALKWAGPENDGGSRVEKYEIDMTLCDNTTIQAYSGAETDCIVSNLLPGRPHLFQVRATNSVGPGPWSDPLEVVTGAGPPDRPKEVRPSCKSAHSVAVSWDEPLNNGAAITEYRLEIAEGQDIQFSQVYLGTCLKHEVSRLHPATSYWFRVQAVNSAGCSQWSPVSPPCLTQPSSPGAVSGVRGFPQACSVMLSWTAPSSNGSPIISYNIQLGDRIICTDTDSTEYLLEELEPETTYRIRIQAINSIGVGAFSSTCKVRTASLPPAPPRLECVAATHNSLRLRWGGATRTTTDYTVFVLDMENSRNNTFNCVYTGPLLQHKIGRLTESSTYRFRITATNEAGEGPPSPLYEFKTTKAPPYPIKVLKLSNVTENGCQISWKESKAGEDELLYQVQLLRNRDQDVQIVYKGSEIKYQLNGLSANTEYSVRVCPIRVCNDGQLPGPYTPYTIFTTRPKEPTLSTNQPTKQHIQPSVKRKPLSDQQKAGLILLGVLFLGILLALIMQSVLDWSSTL